MLFFQIPKSKVDAVSKTLTKTGLEYEFTNSSIRYDYFTTEDTEQNRRLLAGQRLSPIDEMDMWRTIHREQFLLEKYR